MAPRNEEEKSLSDVDVPVPEEKVRWFKGPYQGVIIGAGSTLSMLANIPRTTFKYTSSHRISDRNVLVMFREVYIQLNYNC